VETAHAETGTWLKDDPGYTSWESSDSSGLLLIRGKPGSGKSTLAKYTLESLKSKYPVTANDGEQTPVNVLVADFFYSLRGGEDGDKPYINAAISTLPTFEPGLKLIYIIPRYLQAEAVRRRSGRLGI
jgi:energy-coupling factor transporter ATP-binding protein EcfA2